MREEKLLRSSDVAAQFSVDINTIARWVREKKLTPVTRTMGGHARFSQESVDAVKHASAAQAGDGPATNETPVADQPTLDEVIEEYKDVVWRPASNSPMTRREAPSQARREEFRANIDRLNEEDIKSIFGIDRKELHQRIWSTSVTDVALSFGVPSDTLRRFCDSYRVPIPPLPPVGRKRR